MIIEIQLRGELLRRIVRNRFLAQAFCVPDLPGAAKPVLDHVDFGQVSLTREDADMPVRLANGTTSTVTGHHVRLTQPVTFFIATHAQIVAGGSKGPQNFSQSVDINLFFDLTGELQIDNNNQVTGAAVTLAYAGSDLPANTLPGDVQMAMDEVLNQVQQSTPLDLGPLAAALETTVAPGNIGVATDPSGTRIAIRLELAPVSGNPTSMWTSFYSVVPDRLMGRDWSVLVDSSIITETIGNQFASKLSGSSSKFELSSGPEVTWQSWLPGVKIYFEGNITDVCDFTSIGVEVTAHTTFSLEQGTPPQLKASTHLTWDLVDSDVFLCGLEGSLFIGTFGAVIGAAGGPIGAAIGAVIGILVGIVGVAIFAGSADASKLPNIQPEGCDQTSAEDADYLDVVCHRNLNPVQVALLGSLAPDQLAGSGSGLLLLGGADVPQREPQFFTKKVPLGWDQHLNCNTKSVDTELQGGVENSNAVGIGWQLCDIHFEDDAQKFFIPGYSNANKIEIWLDYAAWDAYFANPYPCHLYVRASCGTRWYNFGKLPTPPAEPSFQEVIVAWATYCSPAYNGYWGGRYNPHWLIDPDPPWERTLHRWDVVATGLKKNNVSVLADAEGHVLGRAVANAAGRVVHSSVLTPAVSQGGLQLGQKGASKLKDAKTGAAARPETPPADGRLLITQTLLAEQATVAINGELRALALPGGAWSGLLVIVTTTGLHVYALPSRNLRGARLTFQLLDSGLRGVADFADGLLLAGDGGVEYRPWLQGALLGNPRSISASPARGAAALRGIGCVLTGRAVQIIGKSLRPQTLLRVDRAEAVGTLAGLLAVVQRKGRKLALFQLGREHDVVPQNVGTVNLPMGVQFRGDMLVGVLNAEETVTLPGNVKTPVERDPWLASAWRLPGQYVHLEIRAGRATVFMVRRQLQTWKSPYRPSALGTSSENAHERLSKKPSKSAR
jgi:hypothetical protein